MRLVVVVALCSLVAAGCTDAKGASCSFTEMFADVDGERYCPDPAAPDDCERFVTELSDVVFDCTGEEITEEETRASLEASGNAPDCTRAVATDVTFESCMEQLAVVPCDEGTFQNPVECVNAIKIAPAPAAQ